MLQSPISGTFRTQGKTETWLCLQERERKWTLHWQGHYHDGHFNHANCQKSISFSWSQPASTQFQLQHVLFTCHTLLCIATHCYALPCSYVWQLRSQRGKYCLHWRPQDTPTIRSFSSDNFDIANVHKCSYFTCLLFLQEMAGKMVDAAAGHAQPCCQNTLASESHQTSSPSTSLHWELRRVLLYGIDSMLL